MTRCPNGTRKDKTGKCESKSVLDSRKRPRCPNGTRKDKTGKCESKSVLDSRKRSRCPNGTRKNRNTGKCENKSSLVPKKRSHTRKTDKKKHLTSNEALAIMDPFNFEGEKQRQKIKRKLMKLTFNKKYKSCLTGEKTTNLYSMASDKLACFFKYNYEI